MRDFIVGVFEVGRLNLKCGEQLPVAIQMEGVEKGSLAFSLHVFTPTDSFIYPVAATPAASCLAPMRTKGQLLSGNPSGLHCQTGTAETFSLVDCELPRPYHVRQCNKSPFNVSSFCWFCFFKEP